jgi:glutamate racemase
MIGVFDSGIGGLTVARALRRAMPRARILYFGDVARMPFGNKSAATVTQYGREISRYLIGRGARLLVIACNTVSAVAAETLRRELDVPVFDVISPAVRAATELPGVGRIGVIGTRGTVASGAYQRAIAAVAGARTMRVHAVACPMFVPIVEEGFGGTPEGRAIVRRTLRPLAAARPDAVILGCTHYPLLQPAIRAALPGARLVDSRTVAEEVRDALAADPALAAACQADRRGTLEVVVTDRTEHFVRFAARIMHQPIRCQVVPHEALALPAVPPRPRGRTSPAAVSVPRRAGAGAPRSAGRRRGRSLS